MKDESANPTPPSGSTDAPSPSGRDSKLAALTTSALCSDRQLRGIPNHHCVTRSQGKEGGRTGE
jgi:hypothetical protein